MRAIALRWAWPAALVACLAAAGMLSVATGLDANWDLKNYHAYDAYAFLNDRLTWDAAPAQIQTFHNPLADLGFHALVARIASPRIIAFAMAMPAGIAAFLLLRMLVALFPAAMQGRWGWIAAAFAIGTTGSSGRAVIGSTMNEWPPAMLLMVSLTAIVSSIARRGAPALHALALAGFATGLAMGLKLTYGVFAVALVVALPSFGTWRERTHRAAWTIAFLLAGFLVTYGFWGARLWSEFGNPFFPYFNNVFHSPWWENEAWFDRNYGPRNALEAIFFPFVVMRDYARGGEAPFIDARLAALWIAGAAAAVAAFVRRVQASSPEARNWIFLATFAAVAYAAWLQLYGIYRYLVPLELLSGPLIVGALVMICRTAAQRAAAIGVVTLALVTTTQPPDLGRLPFRGAYFDVAPPDIAPHSLVILGPYDPMSYAIEFLRADARFVSPNNNFLNYSQRNLLEQRIHALIASHEGPLYSLDLRAHDRLADILEHFGLERVRSTCLPIRSYLDDSAMQLCRLERMAKKNPAVLSNGGV